MKNRTSEFIRQLNSGEGTLKQRIASLIILSNIKSSSLREKVEKINSEAIINHDESGILLAYYVKLLAKVDIDYTPFLDSILTKLEDENVSLEIRVKIAKAIITT